MELTVGLIIICMIGFFVAGFIDSIAGGGGLITLPVLLAVGLPPHTVLGTNKFATTLGTLSALGSFLRSGYVVKWMMLPGFLAACAGGLAGAGLAMLVNGAFLGKILVLVLPVALVFSLVSGRYRKEKRESGEDAIHSLPRLVLCGLCIGLYDGMFGPCTGSFFILALNIFLGLGLVHASATAKVLNLASNFGAFVLFASGGVVLYSLALPGAAANIAGNLLGAHMAMKVGAKAVRLFLYVAFGLLAVTLVYRYFIA